MYGCLRVRELTKGEFLGALEVKNFFVCMGVAPDALPLTCFGLLAELHCRVSSKSPKRL